MSFVFLVSSFDHPFLINVSPSQYVGTALWVRSPCRWPIHVFTAEEISARNMTDFPARNEMSAAKLNSKSVSSYPGTPYPEDTTVIIRLDADGATLVG